MRMLMGALRVSQRGRGAARGSRLAAWARLKVSRGPVAPGAPRRSSRRPPAVTARRARGRPPGRRPTTPRASGRQIGKLAGKVGGFDPLGSRPKGGMDWLSSEDSDGRFVPRREGAGLAGAALAGRTQTQCCRAAGRGPKESLGALLGGHPPSRRDRSRPPPGRGPTSARAFHRQIRYCAGTIVGLGGLRLPFKGGAIWLPTADSDGRFAHRSPGAGGGGRRPDRSAGPMKASCGQRPHERPAPPLGGRPPSWRARGRPPPILKAHQRYLFSDVRLAF